MTTTIRCPHCSMHFEYETDDDRIEDKIAELEKQLLECDGFTSTENMIRVSIRNMKDLLK